MKERKREKLIKRASTDAHITVELDSSKSNKDSNSNS
jgi:hypothetical protein